MRYQKSNSIMFFVLYMLLLSATVPAFCGELAGHKFLITSVRTGETEIFLIDPDTGDAANLTRSPNSEERYPCWSPDGRQVAFTSNRDGTYNLYVMDAEGSNVRQLTDEKDPTVAYMPSWSGDGKQIVFGLHGEQPWMAGISPDGKNFRILGKGHDPCISPDGKKIAFTYSDGKGWCVFVCNADGSNRRQITYGTNQMGAVYPNWSPDGKKIVYANQVGEALEQFVCDSDGRNVRQLTRLGKVSCPAAWSPDGQWISFRVTDNAFWRNEELMKKTYEEKRGDKRPVWVVKADGSNPHIVEVLRYQCAIDGSRAAWKPVK
jgi:TolB protein